jgi:hypothetical protein
MQTSMRLRSDGVENTRPETSQRSKVEIPTAASELLRYVHIS